MRKKQKLAPNSLEPKTDDPLNSEVVTIPALKETKCSVLPIVGTPIVDVHRESMRQLIAAFPKNVQIEERDRSPNLQITAILKYDLNSTFRDEVATHIRTNAGLYPPGSLPQLLLKMIELRPSPVPQKAKKPGKANGEKAQKPKRVAWDEPEVIPPDEPIDYTA